MLELIRQKPSEKMWIDEARLSIPYARINNYERLAERIAYQIAKDAMSLNSKLSQLKELVLEKVNELYEAFIAENGNVGKGKGNFTIYNFNRSIKIEVDIKDLITFDDNLIRVAQEKLNVFLDSSIDGVDSFIKDMILDAFNTTRGKLDIRKVLSLRRYKANIKDPRYHEAMDAIDKAIRRPSSKTYTRVFVKNEEGEYESINLNFSNI